MATFLARRGELRLVIVFQGDAALRNTYSLIAPVGATDAAPKARAFLDYLRSAEGRALIGAFGVKAVGEPMFTPER